MHRRGIWLTLLGVAAFAAVVALVPPLREGVASVLSGDAGRLRSELRDLGAGGALVLAGLMLVHAVIPFPSELLNAAAGFVYGFWLALPLVLAGWLLSALATYAIGRGAGRPLLLRLVGEERLEEGSRLIERGGRTGLLAARLIPVVPYSLVGYVSGAARGAAVALHVDHGRRLDPAVRRGRLPRRSARLAVGHRPRRAGRGRLVPRAADRRRACSPGGCASAARQAPPPRRVGGVLRRLLLLASAIVFIDAMFFAAIVPLLPQFVDEFDLSKTGAGILAAAYPAGTLDRLAARRLARGAAGRARRPSSSASRC